MDPQLRRAWLDVITAQDIDAHLAAVGQAQANAALVVEMLEGPPGRIAFTGAGTGQMFDYAPAGFLAGFDITFTDINPAYLQCLEQRLTGRGLRYRTVVDDLEQSALEGPFDAVAAVLVLEHVDPDRTLDTMARWKPARIHIVIQHNPPALASMLTPGRTVPPTIAEFGRMARPALIEEDALRNSMAELGYVQAVRRERPVADGKTMIGLTFRTAGPPD